MKMVYEMRELEFCCSFREHPLISGPLVIRSYCDFVARLLQHDTTTLSLPLCWSPDQKSSIEDLVQVVGNKNRPALRSIKTDGVPEQFPMKSTSTMMSFLPQLPNLQVVDLHLEICMGDSELEQFAKYTQQLV